MVVQIGPGATKTLEKISARQSFVLVQSSERGILEIEPDESGRLNPLLQGVSSESNLSRFVLPAILAISVFAFNARLLSVGFLSDDYWLLASVEERGVDFLGNWAAYSSFYRPLTVLSLFFNLLVSPQPWGFHLFNVVLHVANSVVLFLGLRLYYGMFKDSSSNIVGESSFAFGAALLFAFHPANVFHVAWISGRSDLLACLFSFLTIICHLQIAKGRHEIGLRIARGFFLVAALVSKEIALVIPFILFLLTLQIHLHRQRISSKTIQWRESILASLSSVVDLLVLSALYAAFRLTFVPFEDARVDWTVQSLSYVLVFLLKCYFLYVSPLDPLTAVYQFGETPMLAIFLGLVLVLVSVYVVSSALRSSSKYFWIYSGIVLTAMLGAISLNAIHGVVPQRVMYVPTAATLIVSVALAHLILASTTWSQMRKWMMASVYSVWLASYAFVYHARTKDWQNASEAEQRIAKQIVEQSESPQKPILILTYPHRMNQIVMMWALPEFMHYSFYHDFGTLKNVKVGLQLMGPTFESLSAGVVLSSIAPGQDRFVVETVRSDQFLYPDYYDMRSLKWIPPPDFVVNQRIRNSIVAATVLETNRIRRATKMEIEVLDKTFYNEAQVFSYQKGRMVRIR